MVQKTITVKDSAGVVQTINTINPNGQDVMANSQPVVIASDQTLAVGAGQVGTWTVQAVQNGPWALAPLPAGVTPVLACTALSNVALDVALPVGKAYITGFELTGVGATVATVATVFVAGTVASPSLGYAVAVPAGNTNTIQPLIVTFDPPIPAASTSAPIHVTVSSFGAGNTAVFLNVRGFTVSP